MKEAARKSSFLFECSEFVDYDGLNTPIEQRRQYSCENDSIRNINQLIAAETRKVVSSAKKRVEELKISISSDTAKVLSPASVLNIGENHSNSAWKQGFEIGRNAQLQIVGATIFGYIQVNCEALRKLGKKLDKCLAATRGSSEVGETSAPQHETEEKIVKSLNTLLGPTIRDLQSTIEALRSKQVDAETSLAAKRCGENSGNGEHTSNAFIKSDGDIFNKGTGKHLAKLSGSRDGPDSSGRYPLDEIESPSVHKITSSVLSTLWSYIKPTSNRQASWAFVMVIFCIIVGFQPVFAKLTLKAAHYNEATVVLAEAILSSAVGLVYSSHQNGWVGVWEVCNFNNIIFFAPTAFLRAVEDTLSIMVLRYVDPVTYIVLTQLRLTLTATAAHFFLEKKPTILEKQNIGVITLGLIMYGLVDSGDSSVTSTRDYIFGLVLLLIAVSCKVSASVYVDWAMKSRSHLTIPVQSACISLATIIPGVVFAFCITLIDDAYTVDNMMDGWSPLLGVFVVYIFTKNWMSNTIIKHFSSTTKYIIYAAAMSVTYTFQLCLGLRTFDIITASCICIVGHGVWLYSKSKSTIEAVISTAIGTFLEAVPTEEGNDTKESEKCALSSIVNDSLEIGVDVDNAEEPHTLP